jgi:hypothetical protein
MSDSQRVRPTNPQGHRQRRSPIEQSNSPSSSFEQTENSSIADPDLNLDSLSSVVDPDPNLNSFSSVIDPDPNLDSRPIDHKRMFGSTKHCEIGEPNKLQGLQNHNVWKIKMEAILRREKLWNIVETKRTISIFPITVEGITYESEERLHSEKQRAHFGLILSVADNLIGIVAGKKDLANSWDVLRKMYDVGDQQQILFLTNKLYNISLKEGGDVTTYLMEASNLRNHLSALGETVSDKQLISIILNGLPRSYDMVIQGISYMTNPIFEDVMGKILMENQQMAIQDQKMGQGEALAVQFRPNFFNRGGFVQATHARRGRGFGRPTGLYYANPPHQFPDSYCNSSPSISHGNTYTPRLNAPFRPQALYRPIVTPTTSPGPLWESRSYFTQPTSG